MSIVKTLFNTMHRYFNERKFLFYEPQRSKQYIE